MRLMRRLLLAALWPAAGDEHRNVVAIEQDLIEVGGLHGKTNGGRQLNQQHSRRRLPASGIIGV